MMEQIINYQFCGDDAYRLFVGADEINGTLDQQKFYFFNPSHIKLDDEHMLVATRFVLTHRDVVPGNDQRCGPQIPSVGKNFWWNNWDSAEGYYGTLFYVCNTTFTENMVLAVKMTDDMIPTHWGHHAQDARLIKIGGSIYMHSRDLSCMYQIVIPVCKDTSMKPGYIILDRVSWFGIKEPGHNQQLVSFDGEYSRKYTTVNVFSADGIVFTQYHDTNKIDTFYIKYDEGYRLSVMGSEDESDKELYGVNYGIMPCLSFTTPHIVVGKQLLGVGHIKISNDATAYLPGSNIVQFRNELHTRLQKQYESNYIIHHGCGRIMCKTCGGFTGGIKKCKCPKPREWIAKEVQGYIYMMFYYIISDDFKEMYISDAFLPIDDSLGPKFSLVFPMGISLWGSTRSRVMVSYGEGDYYSKFMIGPCLDDVVAKCKHNVKHIDFHNYKYTVLNVKSSK